MPEALTNSQPVGVSTTDWPIPSEEIAPRFTEARTAEAQSVTPVGWYQEVMQDIVNKTIGPKLRTSADARYARNIVGSGVSNAIAATLALSTDSLAVDALAAGIQGYGSSDINYVNHQNTHVSLTPKAEAGTIDWRNFALDFHLSVASGMPKPVWKIQHVLAHHSHGAVTGYGELTQKEFQIDRRTASGYIRLLAHDTLKTPAVLLGPVRFLIAEMGQEAAKGVPLKEHLSNPGLLAYNISARVGRTLALKKSFPVDPAKIAEVKALLKKAGLSDEELDNLIYDTELTINHFKDLTHIAAAWAAIGVLISVNHLSALPYFLTQVFTKCTDAINHIKPDGSGPSKGMINLNPKLSKNNPGFAWHLVHHEYPFLHPQYYGIIMEYWQKEGLVDTDQYEDCPVQPGADSKVLSTLIPRGLKSQFDYMAAHPKVASIFQGLSSLA